MAEFDAPAILEVLARHDVEFIVIGGWAAVAHGSPLPTRDVDVVPLDEQDNLTRLSSALRELDAGTQVLLASLADIVRSKEAAGRDKDRRARPVLRELVARQIRERYPRG